MNHIFYRKSKKSLHPQRRIAFGIVTNTAVGPLGFTAKLEIGPAGEYNGRPRYHNFWNIWTDPTVMPDGNPRASRVVLHDMKEGQDLSTQKTSIPGTVVSGGKYGDGSTGECS